MKILCYLGIEFFQYIMKKSILLIGYNYYPEPTGIGKYSGEMVDWFAKQGYDCTVITTYPYYPFWKVQAPYFKYRFTYLTEHLDYNSGGSVTIHRCPTYVPAVPSGLKRILLDLSFLATAFIKVGQLFYKQNIGFVIVIAPSFLFGMLGVLYKKIKKSAFVYHIQDMQIEAASDLGLIKNRIVIKLLLKIEKYIFNQADTISTVSKQMVSKIEVKADKSVLLFPNWADTSMFFPIENRESLKVEFGLLPSDKIVLYSGGIGEKQGLEAIIYAAEELKVYPNLKFVVCGSGPYKEKLLKLVSKLELENVIFYPLQPIDKFNKFLNMADLHLVIQKASASDLMMPSKLVTILSVGGLVLVTANESSGLYSLINQYNLGLIVQAENQFALNEGIKQAFSVDNDNIRDNARNYAKKYLFINKIMKDFESELK